jgi:ABC-2 type transport system permease protein
VNFHAIRAIYVFEMARTWRTVLQSIVSPVISTSLYFVVFGAAIGSRITDIDGVSYGAFIVPGLIMLSLLTQSISNASFGIFFPKFTGTIYEVLSAPVSYVEIVISYVGAAATKSVILGLIILATSGLFVPLEIQHPLWMLMFLVLTALTFSLFGFVLGFGPTASRSCSSSRSHRHAPDLPRRQLLLDRHAPAVLADGHPLQPRRVPDQRFRWSFYGIADVSVGLSLGMTVFFLAVCLTAVWWIFKTGYRLKT